MAGDVESALRSLGIDYRCSGNEAFARCPSGNHEDRHPSWSCNTRTGVHHCFSCGYSGNLSNLAATLLNLSYAEAVIWVNTNVGWARAGKWREDYESKSFAPPYLKISEADLALFVPPPSDQLALKGITPEAAQEYNILWDEAKDEWIFPVREPFTNKLWGWQSKNERTFRHYPAGIPRSKTLFGLGAFTNGSTAVLVESPIDVAYLRSGTIRGGLSSFGVQVSDSQFALINRLTDDITIALDADSPGVEQTARICEKYVGIFRRIRVFNYAGLSIKDPGEATHEQVQQGIDNAVPALRWIHVYRKIRSLSNTSSKKVSWPKELISSLYDGFR